MALWSNTDDDAGKPKYLSDADKAKTFGMDTTEISSGSDNVTSVAVATAGSRYKNNPIVTISGGGGSGAAATANILAGVVTSIDVTDAGSGYTSAPTVTIAKPRRNLATSSVSPSLDQMNFPSHGLNAGDVVKYFHGGGTAATGLTNDTTYYVIASGLTTSVFKVSETEGGTEVDITGTGNNSQYFEIQATADQATAVADLGYGSGGIAATHAGWVLRTVGTGGRAGRIQTEVLVAMGSMTSDASDDTVLPDA